LNIRNKFILYGEGLLASCPTPKLEDLSLSFFRGCLFNIFAANLHSWRQFLHPQPQDAPCCGDRDPPTWLLEEHFPLFSSVPSLVFSISSFVSSFIRCTIRGLFTNALYFSNRHKNQSENKSLGDVGGHILSPVQDILVPGSHCICIERLTLSHVTSLLYSRS
jgi:hypothetical protein